jgi:hypothetical protein
MGHKIGGFFWGKFGYFSTKCLQIWKNSEIQKEEKKLSKLILANDVI